jgi:hypothetical protein
MAHKVEASSSSCAISANRIEEKDSIDRSIVIVQLLTYMKLP